MDEMEYEDLMKLTIEEIKTIIKLSNMGYKIVKSPSSEPDEYYGCPRCKETESGICCQCKDMLFEYHPT